MSGNAHDGSNMEPVAKRLRALKGSLGMVIEQSPLAIHVLTPDGFPLLSNSSWKNLWNPGEDPASRNVFQDKQLQAAGLISKIEECLLTGETVTSTLLHDPARTGRRGSVRWLQTYVYPVLDESGRVSEVVVTIADITGRKDLEERLEHQALHDPLTGLPNRSLFLDRVEHALSRTERYEGEISVLFVDLDNFKVVNDSLGHEAGDELLVAVARRLEECLRPEDTLARLGGDEFAILIEDGESSDVATLVAERISDVLRQPFTISGHEVLISASVGIAPNRFDRESSLDLLRNADLAMYGAKEGGKASHVVFEKKMQVKAAERLRIGNDLRRGVEREEFVLHYQPIVSLRTGKVVMVEALACWEHRKGGLLFPSDFIPIAEQTDIIIPIGRQVLREACRQPKEWQTRFPDNPILGVSVNLSARQLYDPGLPVDLAEALREADLGARSLTLEITESTMIYDPPAAAETLGGLRDMGVGIALDDFGTGYSSFSRSKISTRTTSSWIPLSSQGSAGILMQASSLWE
jgi:diguanylate cyclase (GGDEF)-like protein